jgi:hypothetical protein
MIIWGSRTAPNTKGFVIRGCRCGDGRVHLVVEVRTKFTLYFVPTITTSKKVVVICTDCEAMTELAGPAAEATLAATVSKEVMIARLEAAAREAATPPAIPGIAGGPSIDLAIAFLIMMTSVALVDRRLERREVAAGIRGLSLIVDATASRPVRDAAGVARDHYDRLIAWVQDPDTGPLAPMLERAGRALRGLVHEDRVRLIGQLGWLGQQVAIEDADGSGAPTAEAMDRIDEAFGKMGVSAAEAAAALHWCEGHGG